MPDFKDQPDLGEDRGHIDSMAAPPSTVASQAVHLNEDFVEEQGADSAQALDRILSEVGARHGDEDIDSIRNRLAPAFERAGIAMSEIEVDRYAERIHRGSAIGVTPPDIDWRQHPGEDPDPDA